MRGSGLEPANKDLYRHSLIDPAANNNFQSPTHPPRGGVQLAVRKDAADPRVFHFPSRATLVTPIFPVSQVEVLGFPRYDSVVCPQRGDGTGRPAVVGGPTLSVDG